ncbi:MAG: hypothetical protein ABGY96_25290 [bacterium]|nr:hypothetical protein [Gammaproteobacteria bacterium]
MFRQKQAVSLVDWKNDNSSGKSLSALLPSISSILAQYRTSTIPVSTQRSWVLGKTKADPGISEEFSTAIFTALSLALPYLEDLFIYASDFRGRSTRVLDVEQLATLVREEGLDGFLYVELSRGEGEGLIVTLHIHGEELSEWTISVHDDELSASLVGRLVLDASTVLQGSPPKLANEMIEYLDSRNLVSLHKYWLSFKFAAANDYANVKKICLEAIQHDPQFLEAYRALATAYQYLGRIDDSRDAMSKAISTHSLESPRNAVMARALYYAFYNQDYEKASKELEEMLKLSPLDESAINNLAVSYFYLLDFARAKELSLRDLELYPMKTLGRQNSAFYSLYAGDLEEADALAEDVLMDDKAYYNSFMIRALVSAQKGDYLDAKNGYKLGMGISEQSDSVMLQGMADLSIALNELNAAEQLLSRGIEIDRKLENREYLARKMLMQAEIAVRKNSNTGIHSIVEKALETSSSVATLASAIILSIFCGADPTPSIERMLKQKVNIHSRAYLKLLHGFQLCLEQNYGEGISLLDEAIETLDMWLIRLGRAYIFRSGGLLLETQDELSVCKARYGESLSATMDEQPTFRYFRLVQDEN